MDRALKNENFVRVRQQNHVYDLNIRFDLRRLQRAALNRISSGPRVSLIKMPVADDV